ncbi:hypothetical protein HNP46_006356 [Pseudomonas nitritireducens]|uniref:Uncharacterized protein n=1 Tax=Pseudomonas nitroreducens TaxID=46680 RepID=A0A7W7P3W7_PSENT|nr:hypothetical protein [Pseudomonas nitritireducens]MBB4867443.1 hypothetical protein [Pseudomonas nitritireducens]
MSAAQKWVVKVVERSTGRVEESIKASHERVADKIAAGLEINLNHDKYDVVVEPLKVE